LTYLITIEAGKNAKTSLVHDSTKNKRILNMLQKFSL